eukprot:scaffold926_cov166-Ochromonas_danica.AAC.8
MLMSSANRSTHTHHTHTTLNSATFHGFHTTFWENRRNFAKSALSSSLCSYYTAQDNNNWKKENCYEKDKINEENN